MQYHSKKQKKKTNKFFLLLQPPLTIEKEENTLGDFIDFCSLSLYCLIVLFEVLPKCLQLSV